MVIVTFYFIIPLMWCRRQSIASSWNLSINVSWSSSTSWALQGYRSNSCWEIPSLPLDDCVIIGNILVFPSTQTCSCFVLYLEILAIQLMLCSTMEYCYLLCQECHGKFTTLKNSWYKWYLLTSPFFLGSSCWFQPGYQQVSGAVWILPC